LKKAILLMMVLGLAASGSVVRSAWAEAPPQRIQITARRFVFKPSEATVKVGEPVVLVLKSADVSHGLRIADLGINLRVKAGQTGQVTFTPTKAGDFGGHCSVYCGSGHGSMKFMLHVVQ